MTLDISQRPRLIEVTGVVTGRFCEAVQIVNDDAVLVYRHQPSFAQPPEKPIDSIGGEAERIGQLALIDRKLEHGFAYRAHKPQPISRFEEERK